MSEMRSCECGCGAKAGYKVAYDAYLGSKCIERIERLAAKKAIKDVRNLWKSKRQ